MLVAKGGDMMNSGPSFVDVREAAKWIAEHLKEKRPRSKYDEVLAILHLETQFLRLVGLVEEPRPNSVESGYVYREGHWVVEPSVRSD